MKKQDILDDLITRFFVVAAPTLQRTVNNTLGIYTVEVFAVSGEEINQKTAGFVVNNEGEVGEEAYWLPRKIASVENQFITDVKTYIATKISAGTFLLANLAEIDIQNETALYWIVLDVADVLTETKIVLFRDIGNQITHLQVDAVAKTGS